MQVFILRSLVKSNIDGCFKFKKELTKGFKWSSGRFAVCEKPTITALGVEAKLLKLSFVEMDCNCTN